MTAKLCEQTKESARLDKLIRANLACLCVARLPARSAQVGRQEEIGYGG
jgi:hypothetical protein